MKASRLIIVIIHISMLSIAGCNLPSSQPVTPNAYTARLNPDYHILHSWLGHTCFATGRYAEAIIAHEKAVGISQRLEYFVGEYGHGVPPVRPD